MTRAPHGCIQLSWKLWNVRAQSTVLLYRMHDDAARPWTDLYRERPVSIQTSTHLRCHAPEEMGGCSVKHIRRWDDDFELLVSDPEHDKLTCVLMNKSSFGADEEIGRVEVHSPSPSGLLPPVVELRF